MQYGFLFVPNEFYRRLLLLFSLLLNPNLNRKLLPLVFAEYATVGYMAKRIQMRKNRFLAIQKIAEQKKGGGGGGSAVGHSAHDGRSHALPHHSSRHGHGHGSISGHSTLSGHGTLSGGHGPQSGHGTLPHGMSSHGLASHGTMSSHGYDSGGGGHRHSNMGHGGTLSGSLMVGDLDHIPRQTVSVANI